MLSACVVTPDSPQTANLSTTQTPPVSTIVNLPTVESTAPPAPSPTPDTRFELTPIQGTTVVLWHPWTGVRGKVLEQMALEFNLGNPNDLQVELKSFGSVEALLEEFGTSQEVRPNLIVLPPESFSNQTISDLLLPLDDYLNHPAPEIGISTLHDYPDTLLVPVRANGGLTGLPAYINTSVLIYNKSWAQSLGFPASPTTWDEFKAQACSAATFNNNQKTVTVQGTGGWLQDGSSPSILTWLHAFQAPIPFSGEGAYQFSTPLNLAAFQSIKSLSISGCAWNGRNPTPYDYFSRRMALFMTLPAGKIQVFNLAMQTAGMTDEWEVISYPGQQSYSTWVPDATYYSVVKSTSPRDLAGWLVLRWLTDPANELKLAMSDSSLPARTSVWHTALETGPYTAQQSTWMESLSEPLTPPYLNEWLVAESVLEDGFHQLLLADTAYDLLPDLLKNMDDTLTELEKRP